MSPVLNRWVGSAERSIAAEPAAAMIPERGVVLFPFGRGWGPRNARSDFSSPFRPDRASCIYRPCSVEQVTHRNS